MLDQGNIKLGDLIILDPSCASLASFCEYFGRHVGLVIDMGEKNNLCIFFPVLPPRWKRWSSNRIVYFNRRILKKLC